MNSGSKLSTKIGDWRKSKVKYSSLQNLPYAAGKKTVNNFHNKFFSYHLSNNHG